MHRQDIGSSELFIFLSISFYLTFYLQIRARCSNARSKLLAHVRPLIASMYGFCVSEKTATIKKNKQCHGMLVEVGAFLTRYVYYSHAIIILMEQHLYHRTLRGATDSRSTKSYLMPCMPRTLPTRMMTASSSPPTSDQSRSSHLQLYLQW